ncbi:MAG TPA: SAP domain-containing protein [Poseidonia sp.]|nr:SAP domain-containing protein [Poseidonia sp.]
MDEAATTTLTVAKLKALCVLNDLSATGRKAELLQRLLDAGVDKETLGVEVFDEDTATFHTATEEDLSTKEADLVEESETVEETSLVEESEPVMLSLEDEETLTPSTSDEGTNSSDSESSLSIDEDEILDAEILDAELMEVVEETPEEEVLILEETPAVQSVTSSLTESTTTLLEMIQKPQVAAVLLSVLILGAGGWYYLNNQLEPFTADSLRYGDEMRYAVMDGSFMASEEFVEIITDRIETEDDICKIRMMFEGSGEAKITDGDASELTNQGSNDRLGAVRAKGGQGMDWLAVESTNTMDFSGPGKFEIFRHVRSSIPGSDSCSSTSLGGEGNGMLTVKQWTELREEVSLATELDFSLSLEGEYQGTAMSYGIGGLLGSLEIFSPGLGLILQPIELSTFFGNEYITKDAIGTSSDKGWEWRVIGTEKIGSTKMWKVTASHKDIRDLCLGHATMNLWLDGVSPWAVKQSVDVAISSSESNQASCSGWQQRGVDAALPEGELELHHTFERTYLQRGVKALELGLSYDNRPQANELNPNDADLVDWGVDGTHMPDNSTQRSHPLDEAIQCVSQIGGEAPAANSALDNDGYIWRAINQPNGTTTEWNLSWVATDNTAGWVLFSVDGEDAQNLNCEYIAKGAFDDSITHKRDSIPEVLPLEAVEARLMNQQRFPALQGNEALFTTTGTLHDETQIGYLVVVPGSVFGIDITQLSKDVKGASTVDVQREWDSQGWSNQFSLIADASDGRVIGWTHLKSV